MKRNESKTKRIKLQIMETQNAMNSKFNDRIAVQRYEPKMRRNATERTQNETNPQRKQTSSKLKDVRAKIF